MRTIGLIGGTTWLSTIEYYRLINEKIIRSLGGNYSAKLLLYSVNFAEFNLYAKNRDWKGLASYIISIAKNLENAGAECLVICANTPHIAADEICKVINIPLIHIAEAAARVINSKGIRTVGLLGTKFTMEENFFKDKLLEQQIESIIPDATQREFINDSIFNELGKGIFTFKTKAKYLQIINKLFARGAGGIILGCTELPLLIKPEDLVDDRQATPVPVFDTIQIHTDAVVEFALVEKNLNNC